MSRMALGSAGSFVFLAGVALAQTPPGPSEYAGDASCGKCHPKAVDSFGKTSHLAVTTTPLSKGCEACHGPLRDHADNPTDAGIVGRIRDFQKDRCFLCHSNGVSREAWQASELRRAGKTCLDCHRIHEEKEAIEARYADVAVRGLKDASALEKPIGAAACLACHSLHGESLRRTGHEKLAHSSPAGNCESCHGAGSLHAETNGVKKLIVNPRTSFREAEMEACLACHRKVVEESHFTGSEFDRAGLRCTTCHEIHRGPEPKAVVPREPLRGIDDARARATPVGTEVCAACHAQAVTEVASSVHALLLASREKSGRSGCEACHGPGSLHVQTAGRKGTILTTRAVAEDEAARVCLSCHESSPIVHGFRESAHARSGVSCVSCHPAAAHGRMGPPRDEPETCASCHAEIRSQFALPNHHPLPEGGLRCSSCHAVHERVSMINDRKLKQQDCLKCHPQYQGPFVYAHEADRLEGCTACHTPHGSVNRRLLVDREARTLCLACHSNTPPNHEQRTGSIYRRCVDCHTEIHGSDVNRLFLR